MDAPEAPPVTSLPTRLIVDGMNVIGSRPDGWWRDRHGAMRTLVRRLEALAGSEGAPVTVVFDGRSFGLGGECRDVEVLFARQRSRNAADDNIVALVSASDSPAELTVVTSDDDLARRVSALGADVASAGAFRRRLERL